MNLIPFKNKDADKTGEPYQRGISQFHSEIDRLFNRFFNDSFGSAPQGAMPLGQAQIPKVDVSETETQIEVRMEVPGVDCKDIDLEVAEGTLCVRGRKDREKEEKRRNYYYSEREYGTFSRSIPLPTCADTQKVEASFKDGVLTVTFARKPGTQAKRIAIRHA